MGDILSEISGAASAMLVIIGALECYFGYKIFKAQLIAVGFLLGIAVGVGAVGIGMSAGIGVGILVGVLLGVLFAYLSVKVYYLGVFLFVAALSGVAAFLLTGGEQLLLCVIVANVLGIIATIVARHLIIISTSLSGGVAAGLALAEVLGLELALALLLAALFALSGLYVQYRTSSRERPAAQHPAQPEATGKSGIRLPDIRWTRPSPGERSARQATPICPACGKSLPAGAVFCNICGHCAGIPETQSAPLKLPYGKGRFCPGCGKPTPSGAEFCGYCGSGLRESGR